MVDNLKRNKVLIENLVKEEKKVNINQDFVLKLDNEDPFFAAVAIIFKGNKILLGKSLSEDDRFGKLVFPGGHIEKGESPYLAAKREAKEETGIAMKYRALPIIEDVPERQIEGKKNRKIAFVIGDYVGGEIKPNEEFEWLKWISLKDINWKEVYPQNVKILKALINKEKVKIKETSEKKILLTKNIKTIDNNGKVYILKAGEILHENTIKGVLKENFIYLTEKLSREDEDQVRNLIKEMLKLFLWRLYTRNSLLTQ